MTAITFSPEQLEVMNELASYINFKVVEFDHFKKINKYYI